MEFIEGTQISGPLPISEVLRLSIQIADAVSDAHRHGVVHRDLKPGNVMVTKSGAKVLDFGLAKLSIAGAPPSQEQPTLAATLTLTQQGFIIGTPQYMAPEQLEGKEADRRTDIFAFGLVLYEMITGRPAFEGKTQANLIASILAAEPKPVATYQPLIPPALDHLIKTCLAKDPDERRQNMHDVLLELKWIAESGSQGGIPKPVIQHRKRKERVSWAITALAVAAASALAILHFRETPPEAYRIQFNVPAPPKVTFGPIDTPAISPDGRKLAFTGTMPGGKSMLWIRRMDSSQSTALPGTEMAYLPFWSPDSRFIGFFADGKLKKIDANGGPPLTLCDARFAGGGTWNRAGIIIFRPDLGPLYQVSSAGGEAKPLLKLDELRKERGQFAPHFLPDGDHFLYTSYSQEQGKGGIYVGSLGTKESRQLSSAETNAAFAQPGFLFFGRGSTLMAQPFDSGKLQFGGDPFPVAESVGQWGLSGISFSLSQNGVLVYRSTTSDNLQAVWYDRQGKRLAPVGEPRAYRQFTLSPDEKRIAAHMPGPNNRDDLWLLDLTSGILSRFTSDPGRVDGAIWSPDGRELVFTSNRSGRMNLYRKIVGGGDDRLVLKSDENNFAEQWLKDGSLLFLNESGKSFYRLGLEAGAKPETLLKTEYSKDEPRVSPDGRWVVYNTLESGRWEVYVASFPAFAERRQVSGNGGVQGYWAKDGKELFYLALDGAMMFVPIKPGERLETGVPQVLFQTKVPVLPTRDQFAVTNDGQRFLLLESIETETKPLTVVINWPAAAKN